MIRRGGGRDGWSCLLFLRGKTPCPTPHGEGGKTCLEVWCTPHALLPMGRVQNLLGSIVYPQAAWRTLCTIQGNSRGVLWGNSARWLFPYGWDMACAGCATQGTSSAGHTSGPTSSTGHTPLLDTFSAGRVPQ